MTMPVWEKSFAGAMAESSVTVWLLQIWLWLMGDKVKSILPSKSSKRSCVWIFQLLGCKERQAPNPWIAFWRSTWGGGVVSQFSGIFPPPTHSRWGAPLCHYLPPSTTLQNSFSSQLDGIEGLGPKRKQNLMKHFKSLTKIKEASVDEIVEVGVTRAVAEAVQRKLNPQEEVELAQVAEERVDYQTETGND